MGINMNKPYAVLFAYEVGKDISIIIGDSQYYYLPLLSNWFLYKDQFPSYDGKKLHRSEIDISTAVKILKLLGYNETKTR